MPKQVLMLAPLTTSFSPELVARLAEEADAPAPELGSPSLKPSSTEASMCSSFASSCSARSYLREMGRYTFSATWRALLMIGANFLGKSIFIVSSLSLSVGEVRHYKCRPPKATPTARRSRYQRSTRYSLV